MKRQGQISAVITASLLLSACGVSESKLSQTKAHVANNVPSEAEASIEQSGSQAEARAPAGASAGTLPACASNIATFARDIWSPIVKPACSGCHIQGGYAQQSGSKLIFKSLLDPGALEANMESVLAFSVVLLAKVSGKVGHGGGVILKEDSQDYEKIASFSQAPKKGDSCELRFDHSLLDEKSGALEMLSPTALLRKAFLQIIGRLPNDRELEPVRAGGLPAVAVILAAAMQEEGFLDWVGRTYADIFLTDKLAGTAGSNFDYPRFPNLIPVLSSNLGSAFSLARVHETTEIVKHVVKNHMKFTEIVTADYTMLTRSMASAFIGENHGIKFKNPDDLMEFVPGQIPILEGGYAGVLTTMSMLQRHQTTESNRNRARSAMIYDVFLDTNILQLSGQRPADLTNVPNTQTPVLTNPTCATCHYLLDPVAGLLQHYNNLGMWQTNPQPWHKEMLPPGFEREQLAQAEVDSRGVKWLGEKISQDPRFVRATVRHVFTSLIGLPPLKEPQAGDPQYIERLRAFLLQRQILADIGKKFVEEGYNFKSIVRDLVLSPYYRAKAVRNATAEGTLLEGFGPGRMRTPEELERVTRAVTGRTWLEYGWPRMRPFGLNYFMGKIENIDNHYNGILGGIDSSSVTTRPRSSNVIKSKFEVQMARRIACQSVLHDFMLPPDERTMLPYVTRDMLPNDPKNSENIRKNIRHLNWTILGLELSEDDPEIDLGNKFLLTVWSAGQADLNAPFSGAASLPFGCQLNEYDEIGRGPNGSKGTPLSELPSDLRIQSDPNYVMRSWVAVVASLLGSYNFFYD